MDLPVCPMLFFGKSARNVGITRSFYYICAGAGARRALAGDRSLRKREVFFAGKHDEWRLRRRRQVLLTPISRMVAQTHRESQRFKYKDYGSVWKEEDVGNECKNETVESLVVVSVKMFRIRVINESFRGNCRFFIFNRLN